MQNAIYFGFEGTDNMLSHSGPKVCYVFLSG